MFAKRLFQKAANRHQHRHEGQLSSDDFNFRINVHYGIPSTASILAFDQIQRLLAIAALDGSIKIIGGDNIEGLLFSPKLSPYKYLEFLQNQGLLISITNNNDIQIWDLRRRSIACSFKWESNVTAFSVISGSMFMCVGDENGFMSVLKYDADNGQLLQLPYHLSPDSLTARFSISNDQTIVGVLPQPCSSGKRLLIAYESGLIILWDVTEADIVAIRGDKVLQLENNALLNDVNNKTVHDSPPVQEIEDKEISALCWASFDGSILAVGYIDGDILFWNLENKSPNKDQKAGLSHVVKLQLSSADKRLPVVVLHWMGNSKSRNHGDSQLLVYGGDEIGCEEVITILSLGWSTGKEAVKCVGRVDLTLNGSFADMILIPSAGTTCSDRNTSLFILTNPGHVTIYNIASLSSSESPVSATNFPSCIPATDPLMTVSKIFNTRASMDGLSKLTATYSSPILPGNTKWPLTGGVTNHLSIGQDNKVHRLYVAGYQDGSVRMWNATFPVFSLLCILTIEETVKNLADSSCAVTTISFCSTTLRLAVGSDCGLVQVYNLSGSKESTFHFVTETESEVRSSTQVQGPRCRAIFNLQKSRVQALEFTANGTKLIVGYECSRIAVLDVHSSSVLFITDPSTMLNLSSLMSVVWEDFIHDSMRSTNESSPTILDNGRREVIFALTKDASIHVIDGNNGSMISSWPTKLKNKSPSVSLYAIETHAAVSKSENEKHLSKDDNITNEVSPNGSKICETDDYFSDRNPSTQSLKDFSIVLCCQDSIRVYPAKSVVQGGNKSTYKVKLTNQCCWTTVLMKAEHACGLVLLYKTGELEIRSLPDLQVLKEYSLTAYLRWNFKVNLERMIVSTDNDNIALVNGCEVAFVSLLDGERQFGIPGSIPTLHDEVLAAATTAAINANSDPKRKQGINPGILGSVVRGLKGQKPNNLKHESGSESSFIHLEHIFMQNPFPEQTTANGQEYDELNIDDIVIDEPESSKACTSFLEPDNKNRADKRNDREKLLDGGGEMKPRLGTRDEIIAKYRKAGDASSAAGEARNKLLERQEKLEKISRRTEDLRNGAEDFASLANELVKAMENRKWYHI